MGTNDLIKKIDLVVMTGSVPFITAGIFQEDQNDATLISGALSGMSNMFQELLKQGELRHSELYNAHVYIRHLNQMNDVLGLISPEIKHNAQMRIAIIVREGELLRDQELALSELCYSIMVKICEKTKLAKKLVKGNAEGYIPTYHETIEILAEAIYDYRKRARKSIFYEKPNFLQEKEKFSVLQTNDSLLENLISNFSSWLEKDFYPYFFPKFDFVKFFGKLDYWSGISDLKEQFEKDFTNNTFKEQVSAALIQFILQAGLVPLVFYSGDIIERINSFYTNELPNVFEKFVKNLLQIRGPSGITLRAVDTILPKLSLDDKSKVGWQFLRNFIGEIRDYPLEQPYLKQICKILEEFDLKEIFLTTLYQSHNEIIPKEYLTLFIQIVNDNLSKPIDLTELEQVNKTINPTEPIKTPAPDIPQNLKNKSNKQIKSKAKSKKIVKYEINLPKATPESKVLKNQALLNSTTKTFSWVHRYLFGKLMINKKTMFELLNDGLFFYYLSESTTIEIGLILELMESFSAPRTWLIGQLNRIIDTTEKKLRDFKPNTNEKYESEKKVTIDVEHVCTQSRNIAERIISIITQIESDAKKGRITKDNMKSYLESGFLGRTQEYSIPNTRKLLDELDSLNKNLSTKEINLISKATQINFQSLLNNITSLQFLDIPLPEKDSEYPKEIKEIINRFKKWAFGFDEAIDTVFRIGLDINNIKKPIIHENILSKYLRSSLNETINKNLSQLTNSDLERIEFMNMSFQIKNELFKLIGDRLLYNRPLKLFTSIPIKKESDLYLFEFNPIEPPLLSDKLLKFFIVSTKEKQSTINGRFFPYKPYNDEEVSNLTELLISDAFRRAFDCVETSLGKILKMCKNYHSGVDSLFDLLIESYELICRQLTITKTTN